MKFLLNFILILSFSLCAFAEDDHVPIILREPASARKNKKPTKTVDIPYVPFEASARIDAVTDYKSLKAISYADDWAIGEIVVAESQTPSIGIVGFLEITDVVSNNDGTYTLTCELIRHSRTGFMQVGDKLFHLDLTSENKRYGGTTDLLIRRRAKGVSSKYKPLFTQGVAVGETAETLWKGEYLIHWFGQVSYGVGDTFTIGTVVPADLLGAANMNVKWRFFDSDSNVFATGLTFAKIPNEPRSTLNLNFIWDSISSTSVVSHTFFTLALLSFDQAEDTTAIKSLGTSSFQTGYEFILSNWDRVLVGPSYNFEKKAVGGYLSYLKIWDTFHLGLSLNSTNIASLKMSPQDGYYFAFDSYWRF
ncbi:hypothetical protein D3C87_123950 [compost metagenome]